MEANNIKAMREALNETQSVIEKCMEILNRIPDGVEYDGLIDDVADELCDLRDSHVKPALSAPPRNVDVGTAEEQERRWHSNCGSGIPNCKHCKVYEQARKSGLVDDKNMIRFDCRFIWSQMPYEETKGETK